MICEWCGGDVGRPRVHGIDQMILNELPGDYLVAVQFGSVYDDSGWAVRHSAPVEMTVATARVLFAADGDHVEAMRRVCGGNRRRVG